MEFKSEQEYNRLRILYNEIIRGYSFDAESQLYVRHFTEDDFANTLQYKNDLKADYIKQGLKTKDKALELAIQQEEWSKADDEKILEIEYLIADNEKFLPTIVLENQKKEMETILSEKKKELLHMRYMRARAIGLNADDMAEKESIYLFAKTNLYKDEALKVGVLESLDELRDMDDSELEVLTKTVNRHMEHIREKDIRAIACLPFFLNRYSACKDRPEVFFNKSLIQLTNNQLNLILSGNRNMSILTEAAQPPPSLMEDVTIETVVNWYDQQYSILLGQRSGEKSGITKSERVVTSQ